MKASKSDSRTITINRAPVLTLWAAVVAECLGHEWEEALTLGKAVAGMNAQSKGRALGINKPAAKTGEQVASERKKREALDTQDVELFGRIVRVARTRGGIRALDKSAPMDPETVERYLESRFGDDLVAAHDAMRALAKSYPPAELAERGFALYEGFRPRVPKGERGWGAKGVLDLGKIAGLGRGSRP